MLAKDGEIIGDDPKYLTFTQLEPEFDPVTKKHFHRKLIYDYDDGTKHYRITYQEREIIEYFTVVYAKDSVQATSSPALLWSVKKAKRDPSYLRMVGTVTLDRYEGEELVEHLEAPGLWEQIYFGLDEDV